VEPRLNTRPIVGRSVWCCRVSK